MQGPRLDEEDDGDEEAPEKPQRVVGDAKCWEMKSKYLNAKRVSHLQLVWCFQERKAARASKEAMKQLHSESQRLVRGQFTRHIIGMCLLFCFCFRRRHLNLKWFTF